MAALLFNALMQSRKGAWKPRGTISICSATCRFWTCPSRFPELCRFICAFPVRIDTPERRERLLAALQAARLGATPSYPGSTLDIPEAQPFIDHEHSHGAAGRALSARVMTLPTHPYIRPQHIERICTIIKKEGTH